MSPKSSGFIRRMAQAMINMFIPLQTVTILGYLVARQLDGYHLLPIRTIGYVLPWLFMPLIVLLPLALGLRSRKLIPLAVTVLVAFLFTYGHHFVPKMPLSAGNSSFTMMTYNVLYKNQDTARTLAHIDQLNPDILAVHEYTKDIARQMDLTLSQQFAYKRVENGRGFYSQFPITAYEFVPMEGSFGQGGQKVTINIDDRTLTIFSVHPVPPMTQAAKVPGLPLYIPVQVADTSDLDGHLGDVLTEVNSIEGSMVLVGDLNMTDQDPFYDALTDRLRDAFVERGFGFGFTFTPFGNWPLPVWRIDYVMHTPDLTAISAELGSFSGSDHKPLFVRLALPPE